MFWQYILSPQKIINFQTVFLFTLKDGCNKNLIFFLPSQFWLLKNKIYLIFLNICTQNCEILKFKRQI